jgi:site-specific recombinase XerD
MKKPIQAIDTNDWFKLRTELLTAAKLPTASYRTLRNALMLYLMGDSGLRVGEVANLKISDLFIGCEPVRELVVRGEISKCNRDRTVPLTPNIGHLLLLLKEKLLRQDVLLSTDFAFHKNNPQRHLTTRQIQRISEHLAFLHLGYKVHPHQLRHTFATRMMRVTNIRIVQELLGHKSITSTQIYTHPNNTDLATAVGAIDGAADLQSK